MSSLDFPVPSRRVTPQVQRDEEHTLKSLSLPLLPKLPPCRSDTITTEGGGVCALNHLVAG